MAPAVDHFSTGSGRPAFLSQPLWLYAIAGLVISFTVHILIKYIRASRSPLQKLPGPPRHSILFGDFPLVVTRPTGSVHTAWIKQYGPTIRTSLGVLKAPAIVTTDLNSLGYIQRNADLFIKPPTQARMLKRLAGDGVLMAEFHDHRRQRRILNPAFSPAAVRDMVPTFYMKAYELRDRLASIIEEDTKRDAAPTPPKPEDVVPGARKIDMGKFLTELAFDVIGVAGFDYNFRCIQSPNPIVQSFRDALSGLMRLNALAIMQHLWPVLDIIPTKRNQMVDASLAKNMAVGRELVAQKKRELLAGEGSIEKSTETGKDLLSLIVKANMAHDLPENQRLTDEEIIYQVSTFLLAGSETSSNGMSWCLWRLAQNQTLQQRLRDELRTIAKDEPSLEELNALPLLENVIRETLRIDSPVPETIRQATADCHLPISEPIVGLDDKVAFQTSIPVKKGTIVAEPFTAVHRNPAIWGEDAEEFNPNRYDRPNCPAVKVPGSYGNLLSFNGGARNCIGYRFALAQMKAVIFVLLRNFKFEILPSNPEITRKSFIVMLPWVVGEEHVGSQMPLLVRPVSD